MKFKQLYTFYMLLFCITISISSYAEIIIPKNWSETRKTLLIQKIKETNEKRYIESNHFLARELKVLLDQVKLNALHIPYENAPLARTHSDTLVSSQ